MPSLQDVTKFYSDDEHQQKKPRLEYRFPCSQVPHDFGSIEDLFQQYYWDIIGKTTIESRVLSKEVKDESFFFTYAEPLIIELCQTQVIDYQKPWFNQLFSDQSTQRTVHMLFHLFIYLIKHRRYIIFYHLVKLSLKYSLLNYVLSKGWCDTDLFDKNGASCFAHCIGYDWKEGALLLAKMVPHIITEEDCFVCCLQHPRKYPSTLFAKILRMPKLKLINQIIKNIEGIDVEKDKPKPYDYFLYYRIQPNYRLSSIVKIYRFTLLVRNAPVFCAILEWFFNLPNGSQLPETLFLPLDIVRNIMWIGLDHRFVAEFDCHEMFGDYSLEFQYDTKIQYTHESTRFLIYLDKFIAQLKRKQSFYIKTIQQELINNTCLDKDSIKFIICPFANQYTHFTSWCDTRVMQHPYKYQKFEFEGNPKERLDKFQLWIQDEEYEEESDYDEEGNRTYTEYNNYLQ